MTEAIKLNYGPLEKLIGTWTGDKGMDIAPEPDGTETNPYYETITFTVADDVTNAEEQLVTALHYRQLVKRKSNDKVFHDETGYWMWDEQAKTVMHSLTIPRGVAVLAGGVYDKQKDKDNTVCIEVAADVNSKDWGIVQSPFMQQKARTTKFEQVLNVSDNRLTYSETMILDIYGKIFEHTDNNELTKQ